MVKEDKLFSMFVTGIRGDHPQNSDPLWIWGTQRDVKDYDKLARDVGFSTRLFTKREEFLSEIAAATNVLAILLLRDRLSQLVQRAIVAACERLNPLYVLRLHSYVTFEEDTKHIGIVTSYSPLIETDSPAAQRVMEATRQALKRAGDSWKATEDQPETTDQQVVASTDTN